MDDTTQISDFRKRILQDPEALLNDREVMRALISASSNNATTNVIDLKSVVLKRLEGRVDEIEGQNSNIISAAYKNISTTFRVHSAILEALEPKTFTEFLNFLKTDWANSLGIDVARLCLEAPSINKDDIPQLQTEFGPSVIFLQEGEIDHYITLGQDNDPRSVTLRQIRKGASNIFLLLTERLVKLELFFLYYPCRLYSKYQAKEFDQMSEIMLQIFLNHSHIIM